MKKATLFAFAVALALVTGCDDKGTQRSATALNAAGREDKVIKFIMSDLGFNAEVVHVLKDEVAKQGFVLDWMVVNDIIQPNKLVDDGTVDANSFQHEPYFDQFVQDHNLKNVVRGFYTVITPSGLFSLKYKSIDEVPDGATFGIPVDPANNGRALFMLRDRGLLKLREGVPVTHAGLRDITDNPHHYKFKEIDQLMQQRTLPDVDAGFLFLNYALLMKLDPIKDALVLEDVNTLPYKGVVAIHRDLVGSPKIRALQNAYASNAFKEFYRKKYGAAVGFLDHLNH
jgi:D-methionine transport system substrate-binding protein